MAGNTRSTNKGSTPSKGQLSNAAILDLVNNLSAKMDMMDNSFHLLRSEVSEMRAELNTFKEFEKSLNYTEKLLQDSQQDINDLKVSVNEVHKKCSGIVEELSICKKENISLHDRLLELDTYMRRENLKFSGILEEKKEQTDVTQRKIREFFSAQLGISDSDSIEFQRCHRLGSRSDNGDKDRDIIIRFLRFEDRMKVWNKRRKLAGTKFFINEDFPVEIQQRRQKMLPVFKEARKRQKKVLLLGDKLILEGVRYTVDTLDRLPPEFQLTSLATKKTDHAILFYGSYSFLSNFYPAKFNLDGKTFGNVEQYIQYQKAVHTGDVEIACGILNTDNPVKQHQYGRKLKPTQDQWNDQRAEMFMECAVKAKFQQNDALKKELLDTRNKNLVECNAYDKFWGIGLSMYNAVAMDRTKWKGQNKLGVILVKVRDDIK